MILKMEELTALYRAYCKIKDLTFPIRTSYTLVKLGRILEKEVPFYDSELSKIINEYGSRDASGNLMCLDNGNVQIQPDKIDECAQKLNELGNLEVEINCEKIPIEALDGANLSIQDLNGLMPIIQD